MADVKESAMSTASDCKWVRALDANGNSIRISKEDLASVVGELLGTATSEKDGLVDKRNWSQTFTLTGKYQLKLYDSAGLPLYSSGALEIVVAGSSPIFLAYVSFYFNGKGDVPKIKIITNDNNSKVVSIANKGGLKIYLISKNGSAFPNLTANIRYFTGLSNTTNPVFTNDDLSDAKECSEI